MNSEILDNLPAADYHRRPELSASGMKILATKTPAHFRWAMDHGEEHKDAFDLGTATHSLILEDDTTAVEVLDFDDWRTKAAKEARDAAYLDGRVPILRKDWAGVVAMRDSIAAHPLARLALTGGHAERTIIFQHETGVGVRARLDKHIPDSPIGPVIVDLKTTVCADPREFGKTAANYGYHQQDANYRAAAKAATGLDHSMLFVNIEKTQPHLVSVVELSPDFVDLGRRLNDKAARLYADCTATNTWPGYPASDPIEAPTWAALQMEDLLK